MAIPYEVRPSAIKEGFFTATIRPGTLFTEEALIQEIAEESSLSPGDVQNFLATSTSVVLNHLALGQNVQFGGICIFTLGLPGALPSAESEADISKLRIAVKAHREMVEQLRANASLQKLDASYTGPFISSVYNVTQDAPDVAATANLVRIVGSNLKYNPAEADEGIYFIAVIGGAVNKVTVVSSNTEGQSVFQCPTLSGSNYLEVRARRKNSTTLQTYRFPDALPAS